jgi:outer membrane protein assembly factor BamB
MPRNRTPVTRLASLPLLLTCTAAFAEQTGTPRRLIAGDYDKNRIAIISPAGKMEWEQPFSGSECHDLQVLPNGNILFQQSWTKIVEMTPAHKIVWSYDSATMNGNAGKQVQVHAFQRLKGGTTTMLAESGPARIIEVDKNGKLLKQVKLKVTKPDPHRDTRLARKLANGHYLVAHEGDNAVREYDASGKVVWEYPVGSRVYSAMRLKNGNTLMGCGDGHRVIEVDPKGKTVWSLNEHDLPGITLAWVTMVDRLPNGNTLVVNCHAGPSNPQIIEVTPDKKLVWSFKDFDHFGNALPVALMLPERR